MHNYYYYAWISNYCKHLSGTSKKAQLLSRQLPIINIHSPDFTVTDKVVYIVWPKLNSSMVSSVQSYQMGLLDSWTLWPITVQSVGYLRLTFMVDYYFYLANLSLPTIIASSPSAASRHLHWTIEGMDSLSYQECNQVTFQHSTLESWTTSLRSDHSNLRI